ncbi:hypothetical protein E3E12_03100 [Formicincola oecophyllae]|uniref:Uncharacterized protein n=1 Tax=Formicincola oecophyllae TaxID=2558361 RepID=A0A4Y6U857_9PROT|nr:hypothetical protein [Formicincola oecophyllae]QDH13354.1 hypothetical protein E3E12_03100 [Formicincola oecophyllae]
MTETNPTATAPTKPASAKPAILPSVDEVMSNFAAPFADMLVNRKALCHSSHINFPKLLSFPARMRVLIYDYLEASRTGFESQEAATFRALKMLGDAYACEASHPDIREHADEIYLMARAALLVQRQMVNMVRSDSVCFGAALCLAMMTMLPGEAAWLAKSDFASAARAALGESTIL